MQLAYAVPADLAGAAGLSENGVRPYGHFMTTSRNLPIIGWREWVSLPDLGIRAIKAKVDTGARSSSLHAYHLSEFERDGETWVRFSVHPVQRSTRESVTTEARVLDKRSVRSSSGKSTVRPVILTSVSLLGCRWTVEVTLANRDEMGFRMLMGREAVRERFVVDAGRSYFGGRPGGKIRRHKRGPRSTRSARQTKGGR